MDKLQEARNVINDVDKQMAELFEKRMNAVKVVAEYKKERGLPILDPDREKQVIDKNSSLVSDSDIRSYYVNFLTKEMELSRNFQSKLMEGAKVAFSGVAGAFAYEAVLTMFPDGIPVACPDFKAAYEMVVNGKADYAVLPIENSFAGEVGQVVDLLFTGSLYITRVQGIAVEQNLLGLPGTKPSDIKKVLSHPQALSQCHEYITQHHLQTEEYGNTALAAEFVSNLKNPSVGAIASSSAAELYGLEIIAKGINESDQNTTRFAVLSRSENTDRRKKTDNFFLTFTVKDRAGALAEAINIIGKHGYNMRGLHSRPMKTLTWHYYFYIEGVGNVRSENGEAMMAELSEVCEKLRLVGSYTSK